MIKLKPVSKVIIGISSLFLITALYNMGLSLLLKITGEEAQGIVFDYKLDSEGLSKDYWAYFHTEKGDSIAFKNSFHYFWDNRYKRGEKVDVLYLPGNTSFARINTTSEMFGNIFLHLFLFLVFTFFGLFFSLYEKNTPYSSDTDEY